MVVKSTLTRTLARGVRSSRLLPTKGCRVFSQTPRTGTDGVFRELTAQRTQIPWIEALRKQQEGTQDATASTSQPATPQDRDLSPKRMKDSHHAVLLPLGQDPWLLDTYANATGQLRLGTLLMDLDALAGVIAYKHTGEDVTTVTASFDRIVIQHPLTEICDLELSGMVTYATGRSSMEISLQVAKAPKEGEQAKPEDIMITCQCTMVSLDPATKKPANINPVRTDTEEEKRLFQQGEKNSKHRKELSQRSLLKQTPDDEESDLIHAIWQRQLQYHDPNDPLRKPDNVHYMDATKLQTAQIMMPQYRNRHNFQVFGGFLLKQTFELAFCCAASFAHSRPTFVSLDPSTFQNPVPVGSVLYLTATVVYTDPPVVRGSSDAQSTEEAQQTRVQIRVDSKVRNVEHGETKPTGQFNYTFVVDKQMKVMPRSYTEYVMYVDARRRARSVLESLRHGEADADRYGRWGNPAIFSKARKLTDDDKGDGDMMAPPRKRTKLHHSATQVAAEPPKSRLMGLPAELRNEIYRYALVRKNKYHIKHGKRQPKEPGLLLANKQIREEAASIYYQENTFYFVVVDNNARPYLEWTRASELHHGSNYLVHIRPSTNYNNLIDWTRRFHYNMTDGKVPGPFPDSRSGVIQREAFVVAKELKRLGLSWCHIKSQLERIQRMLVVLDGGYM
ncbi:uncharacterized protein LTR77_004432 [Saxophila tyrrhenica]|uniref:HotDog ACOT-type domain-containing protein n=1 Tax=Saxophila tyrrhenica TaxID=1690608 RepID=A0AAV9PDW2_9PEZI|nr:hypothetical protein LTR77_004432 [Saxophila tyrrhenica]